MKISNNNTTFGLANNHIQSKNNQPSFGALRADAADMFMKKAGKSLDDKGKNIVAEAIQTLAKNISESFIDIGTGKSKVIKKSPFGKVQISATPAVNDVLTIIDAHAVDNQIKPVPFGKILGFEQDGSNVFVKMSDRLSDTQNGAKKLSVQDFVKQLTELVNYKEKTAAKETANKKNN